MAAINPILGIRAELDQAERYRQSRNHAKARDICERLLKAHPDYSGALHTAGLVYADMGNRERSLQCLSKANAYCPGNPATLTALGTVFFQLGNRDVAARFASEAAEIDSSNAPTWHLLAEVRREDSEYELALEAYQKTLELEPGLKAARVGVALTLSSLGRHAESAHVLEGLLKEDERDLAVISTLATLPRAVRSVDLEPLIAGIRRDPADRHFDDILTFTRARLAHEAGMHSEAWRLLKSVNDGIHSALRDAPAKNRAFEQERLNALKTSKAVLHEGDADITSLFILGPSRSGKTTVESILSSAGHVKCGYENQISTNALSRTLRQHGFVSGTRYHLLPPELEHACRAHYMTELARRASGRRVFTNTSPERIHDLHRMFATLPNVRAIFVKRNIEDNVFNIYRTQYKTGNYYSYNVANAISHVKWYHEMMDRLAEMFPDRVAMLNYEDIVEAPERAIAAARQLCGDIGAGDVPRPPLGNDIGVAQAYREFIA
jgi:tetratricopeptide (TPR) repeat protein